MAGVGRWVVPGRTANMQDMTRNRPVNVTLAPDRNSGARQDRDIPTILLIKPLNNRSKSAQIHGNAGIWHHSSLALG